MPTTPEAIEAGFNSRLGAIQAVMDSGANFQTAKELRDWLSSDDLAVWSATPDWPTPETRAIWIEFVQSYAPPTNRVWADRRYRAEVTWFEVPPQPGLPVQLHELEEQQLVLAADGVPLGTMQHALPSGRVGLIRAQVSQVVGRIDITYLGPKDLVGT